MVIHAGDTREGRNQSEKKKGRSGSVWLSDVHLQAKVEHRLEQGKRKAYKSEDNHWDAKREKKGG